MCFCFHINRCYDLHPITNWVKQWDHCALKNNISFVCFFLSSECAAARRSPPVSKKRQLTPTIAIEKRVVRSPPNKRKRVSDYIDKNRKRCEKNSCYFLLVHFSHHLRRPHHVNLFRSQSPAIICERKNDRAHLVQVNNWLNLRIFLSLSIAIELIRQN